MGRNKKFDRTEAIEAAKALFWRQGYDGASLRDLSDVLNMHSGSIYKAFGNKEGLFAEVLDQYAEQNDDLLTHCLTEHPDPIQGYGQFLAQVALAQQDCKTCMVAKAAGGMSLPEALRQKAQTMLRSLEQKLVCWLESQKQAGHFRDDLDSEGMARFMQSQIVGIRTLADSGLTPGEIQQTIDLQLNSMAMLLTHGMSSI